MPRLNLLGVRVSAFDLPTAVAEMDAAIAAGRRAYACTCPVYTLMQGHERPEDAQGPLQDRAFEFRGPQPYSAQPAQDFATSLRVSRSPRCSRSA